jgi:phosphatidate cytidylyltransferase
MPSGNTPGGAGGSEADDGLRPEAGAPPGRPRSSSSVSNAVSRIAIALAGLPIVLAIAWIGGWLLFGLVLASALLALHELYSIARGLRPLVLAGYGGAAAGLAGAMLGGPEWLLAGLLATFPLAFFFAAISQTRQSTTVALAMTLFGAIWVGTGLALLMLLRDEPASATEGRHLIFATLITVFATDTFAYVGGRVAGRHKMSPVISPGKTWEGWLFGTLAGVFACWIVFYKEGILEQWESLLLGGVIVVAATIGDLFESLVKRDLGVKDTGHVLGGHGGVLDRIDSLLFAGPAAFVTLLGLGTL